MSRLITSHQALRRRVTAFAAPQHRERGDVPGWVLVTLMTAGLVTLLWQTAGPLLQSMFTTAMNKVSGL